MTVKLALNQREAAAALGIGVRTFRTRVRPHLNYKSVGQSMLFSVAELERWLDSPCP